MSLIVADPIIAEQNKRFEGSGELSKDQLVTFISQLLQSNATNTELGFFEAGREGGALGAIAALVTPMGQPRSKNEQWKVIEKIVEALPAEYKWGLATTTPDGQQQIYNDALRLVNYDEVVSKLIEVGELDSDSKATQEVKILASEYLTTTQPLVEEIQQGLSTGPATPQEELQGVLTQDQFGSEPPEETLRADVQKGLESVPGARLNLEGLIGGEQYIQDCTRRRTEFLSQMNLDSQKVNLPVLNELTPGQARQYIYGLDRSTVMALQRMLGRAGYFNEIGRAYSTLGTVDDNTKLAWDTLLLDSVRQKKPVDELLKERISNYASEANVEYSDPLVWEQSAQKFAASVLQRTLSSAELSSFVRAVRGWERESALGPTVTGQPKVNVEAQAQRYFDDVYAQERATANVSRSSARYVQNIQGRD